MPLDIAQYSANVMISEGARRKRQSMMIQNPLVDSVCVYVILK